MQKLQHNKKINNFANCAQILLFKSLLNQGFYFLEKPEILRSVFISEKIR